ncbi:hypothetical protein [Natronobacterium gregoryi]|uniref:Uncharacterized protein n=2 Tax=Natronobacterium gregoryi TaxID=44930 RepID=L0AMK1_NATGS|nr:hypothetical protein [Natronobacterium gregoryi]AFZ74427.1 hypothetical protein Natgr_3302 [Natronobacterium gregoryi SP2]ELY72113.1 hypothetical protein C490_04137 [Natronobacterium gregoryi SP2]PLK19756.1 hypothetical protein CYV19_13195 [Natronobacterium gregoryi SP2]SFJ40778.1 hypothetical protein SAMN05443661_12728 [Natronobacterium gregoryi]
MGDKSARDRIQRRRENDVDPETFLETVGAIQAADGTEQLGFTPAFESLVRDRLETIRETGVDAADVARLFGVERAAVDVPSRPYTAYEIHDTVRNWPSDAALKFDVAVDTALRETTDRWSEVTPRQRYRIAQSVRSFQGACFFCGGQLDVSDTSVESCCGSRGVLTIRCDDCARRFLEFTADRTDDVEATAGGN